MKNIIKISLVCILTSLMSCDDFLDRTPLDTVSEESYYSSPSELRAAMNNQYQDLPGWSSTSVGYQQLPDSYSDMGTAEEPSNRLSGLDYTIAESASNSVWSFDEVREINWFLDHVDNATGDTTEINHYIGEAYFFRAYYYFDLLKKYGDVPILDKYFTEKDTAYIYAARDPRNEVVDFMLADLDTAISLLQKFDDIAIMPRISKEVGQAFKSRVALYEGTWEKYHAGTDFGVSGSDGSEYLQIAADAAKAVIDAGTFELYSDYQSLFNQIGLSGNPEVMLWRDYDYYGLNIGNALQLSWPNRSSFTRFAIRSYLCTDGKPISVSSLYTTNQDHLLSTVGDNRDPRLSATLMEPGDVLLDDNYGGITEYEVVPFGIFGTGNTGYISQKYRDPKFDPESQSEFTRNTSRIIFRYAEVLLNYAEAKATLGSISQADLDISINVLRDRVSMPHLTTTVTTDPDWPNYGYTVSPILYEVRRERSVELMAEGFRADDLYRWRAHTLFDNDQPRGAYYEGDPAMVAELSDTEVEGRLDDDGYILPFTTGNYNFDESKAYLTPIPLDELVLNPNLVQNPGW